MQWKLTQVAVVVRDMDRAIENYTNLLGIGPFRKMEIPLTRAEVRGRPVPLTLKLAMARLGDITLELVQAEPGDNIYWEFLQQHGEAMHHLGFDVADLEAELARLGEKGIGVLQRGRTDGVSFAYLDTVALGGAIVELIQRGQP